MSVAAKIKFVQGASTPPAGEALIGVLTTQVVASNGDNASVSQWEWEWVAVPTGSALVTGIIASGNVPTTSFVPDQRGTYVLKLRVYDRLGNIAEHILCFAVQETTGRLIPNFVANDNSLNFNGQLKGWHPYVEQYFKEVDRISVKNIDKALLADFTTTSNSAQPTTLAFTAAAGEHWVLRFGGNWSSQDANGVNISVDAPADGALNIEGNVWGNGTTTTAIRTNRLTGTGLTTAAFSALAGTLTRFDGMARVKLGAVGGTVRIRVASVTNGQTCTVKQGAWLQAVKVEAV